jgi:hypothetical protein
MTASVLDHRSTAAPTVPVTYHPAKIDGVNIFYREAGPTCAPVVLLLHGFPTSTKFQYTDGMSDPQPHLAR